MAHDYLFPLEAIENEVSKVAKTYRSLKKPLWTEEKARLIEKYLWYFVFVTKSGTYIDAFAGPQTNKVKDGWAAKRVIESDPKFLRNFFLFEVDPAKISKINSLIGKQPEKTKRNFKVIQGDFNEQIKGVIDQIPTNEPIFCLLDQRTSECHWDSVKLLASHRQGEFKVELFYFLAEKWLNRALKSRTKSVDKTLKWWGRDDWEELYKHHGFGRAQFVSERFRKELGYKYVCPYPIIDRQTRTAMFYMIHASDHPRATPLMAGAYSNLDKNDPDYESQLQMNF